MSRDLPVFLLVLGLLAALIAATQLPPVRVVGYGCEGSKGPLYAAEEDHLPKCANVEPL